MKTYEQDVKELNITEEEFDNVINHIYGKTAEEMVVLAKVIKSGMNIGKIVIRAFEHVLAIRQVERLEAFLLYYDEQVI